MTNGETKLLFEKFNFEKDLNDQRKLFKECFPENSGTSVETNEHYFWKFHSFPNIPPSYEYVAKSNGEIIGYYASLPYKYKVFGKEIAVAMVCDVMTGIKARGKGIFTKLGMYSTSELKKEGLAFTTGYPIRPEVIPGHLKANWQQIFDLPLYISFLKLDVLLKKKHLNYFSLIPNQFIKFFHFIIGVSKSIKLPYMVESFSNKEISKIDGFNDFIKEWLLLKPIGLIKNTSFLEWRFNAPGKEYEIIVIREKKKIIGVAITRFIIKESVPSLGVIDFMSLNDDKLFSDILHKSVLSTAKKYGAEAILGMLSKTNAKKLRFLKNGFIKSPFKFKLIIKNLNADIEQTILSEEKNWALMWIDSDDL